MKLFFTTLSIILLFLVSTFTGSFAQINWTKDTLNNPVLTTGPEGSWDDYILYPHGILFDGTTYHMWYGGHDGTNVRIGYASSNDGISWEKHPENPILDLGEKGEWDYYWAYRPCVLYKDNTYHMWYSGYDLSTVRIGYATSQDGISWEKNPQNPVLDLGEVGVWDDGHTGAPSVLYMDGKYHMWYEGGKKGVLHIGYATSPDGITWERYAENPVMKVGPPGSWEYPRLRHPDVCFDGNTYHMWYSGNPVSDVDYKIGYATSPDGITWTKYSSNPVLSPTEGAWDDMSVAAARVVFDSVQAKFKMWYGGMDTEGNINIGYATSPINIYAHNSKLNSAFMQVNVDSLIVNTEFVNPNNHNFSSNAIITSIDSVYNESIPLYDDGNHGDLQAEDGIWGNYILPISIENEFMVGFSTMDLVSGSHLDQSSLARFTTIGPVVLDFVEITSSDTIPNPGDQIRVRLNLKNEGLSATALDITTPLELISLDSNATIKASGSLDPSYGDIAPGESSAGSKSYNINFFDTCQTDKEFIFMVNIYSGEYSYWSATFSLYVYPTGILEISTTIPTEFVLHQNYPNPFNPSTTIKFDLPRTSEVSLKIFNILGEEVATLVSENLSAGSYSYEWDGLNLPSGLYLYRLEAEKFVESKKMILMK